MSLKHWSWIGCVFLTIALAAAFTAQDLSKTFQTYLYVRTVEARIIKIYQPYTTSIKGTTSVYSDLQTHGQPNTITIDAVPGMQTKEKIEVRVFKDQARPLVNGRPNLLLIAMDSLVPLGFVTLLIGLCFLLFGGHKSFLILSGKWLCWITLLTWIGFGILSIYKLASLGYGHMSVSPLFLTGAAILLATCCVPWKTYLKNH